MNTHTTSCPTCERMGRITVTRDDGTLTTATCPNCNGYGVVATHDEDSCSICNPATEERSSAYYPRTGEIEAAYKDESRVVWIMQGKVRKTDPTHWFRAYLVRVDNVTNDASYTTDGVWFTPVKDGRWTFDKSGLSDAAPDDEVEAPAELEEWEAYAQFSDYLDESNEPYMLNGSEFTASRIMSELDWAMYHEEFLNYVDFMGLNVKGY